MPKSIRLIPRYREPIPFEDDARKIATKLASLGYKISIADAYRAWKNYSEAKIVSRIITDDGPEPKWVKPPKAAREVFAAIEPYVQEA